MGEARGRRRGEESGSGRAHLDHRHEKLFRHHLPPAVSMRQDLNLANDTCNSTFCEIFNIFKFVNLRAQYVESFLVNLILVRLVRVRYLNTPHQEKKY